MQQYREDLQPFDMKRLNEIRKLRMGDKCSAGANSSFWDELECILKCNPISRIWARKDNDDVVLGEVW